MCHFTKNTSEDCLSVLPFETICHPDPNFADDVSATVLLGLAAFLSLFFLLKAYWLLREWDVLRRKGYEYPRVLTLATLFLAILFTVIACWVDRQHIKYHQGSPMIGCPLGILEIFVLLSAIWLLVNLVLKMRSNRVVRDHIFVRYLKDPEIFFELTTLIPAVVAVLGKNYMMASSGYLSGVTAVSIATATAVIVIKIGHSNVTTFGNFATTFHIILKKIPFYFLAVLYLLHGFSFAFWILENKAASEKDERSFNDYWRSGISVIMMSFGLTEFDFGGPFKYAGLNLSSGSSVTVVFAYILLTLMVLLVMLGLLNLLLSAIIKAEKETREEVRLNHIIFMAQYAIYLEGIHWYWKRYCGMIPAKIIHFGQRTVRTLRFDKEKTAKFCTRQFYPMVIMEEEESEKGIKHIPLDFDWVVKGLTKIEKGENLDGYRSDSSDDDDQFV